MININSEFKSKPVNTFRRVTNRKFGVGADSLITVEKPLTAGALGTMRMFNYDGSESEMCGNGIRCAAKFLFDRKLNQAKKKFKIDTKSGPKEVEISHRGKLNLNFFILLLMYSP